MIVEWESALKCYSETCTNCKGAMHYGTCNEMASKDIFEAVEANGWQRCSACHRIVELGTGCNHITLFIAICWFRLLTRITQLCLQPSILLLLRGNLEMVRMPYIQLLADNSSVFQLRNLLILIAYKYGIVGDWRWIVWIFHFCHLFTVLLNVSVNCEHFEFRTWLKEAQIINPAVTWEL